jgi:hypothetical protein
VAEVLVGLTMRMQRRSSELTPTGCLERGSANCWLFNTSGAFFRRGRRTSSCWQPLLSRLYGVSPGI